jgi:hypothetical protein
MRGHGIAAALALLVASTILTTCGIEKGPPLSVTDLDVRPPRSGTSMAVAYLTVHNNSGRAVRVDDFASPQFGKVELHESLLENGVSRMRKVESLTIDPGASVALEPGGKHLMLLQPLAQTSGGPGLFTLQLYSGDTLLLSVSGTMETN